MYNKIKIVILVLFSLSLISNTLNADDSKDLDSFIDSVLSAKNYDKTRLESYNDVHRKRYKFTLEFMKQNLPTPKNKDFSVLEIGLYLPLNIEYLLKFNNIQVFDAVGGNPFSNEKYSSQLTTSKLSNGQNLKIMNVDIQNEMLPYKKEQFDLVMLFEVLEHLPVDPMYTMAEINRVTKMNGLVILSTPNITSYKALYNIFTGHAPYLFGVYKNPRSSDRHNHEWSPLELKFFMKDAGFEIVSFETTNCYEEAEPGFAEKMKSVGVYDNDRGDTIILLAKKVSSIVNRFPPYIYYGAEEKKIDTKDYP